MGLHVHSTYPIAQYQPSWRKLMITATLNDGQADDDDDDDDDVCVARTC